MQSKKEGIRERDRLINELEEHQKRNAQLTKYVEELEEKHAEDEDKIKDLYRQLEDVSNDSFKGKRALEHVQNKLQETTDERQIFADDLKKYKQQVCHCKCIIKENDSFVCVFAVRNRASSRRPTESANARTESQSRQANYAKQLEQHEADSIDWQVKSFLRD